ncbi:MAG: hypothetical protein ACOX2G_11720 [Bacillota bacterium]|jgi:hypothetical protein
MGCFSVNLTYDVIAFKKADTYDYPQQVFEKKLLEFISGFDALIGKHIPWLPTSHQFFGGFDLNFSASERVSPGHYKFCLAVTYEPGISRNAVEELGEQAKDYISKLNQFFRLFGIDIQFMDNPEIEYVDDGEEYEDLFE